MAVKETSKLAYIGINEDGTAISLRGLIYNAIRNRPGSTRKELAEGLGVAINSVCGRVNELLKAKHVHELPKRKDISTGRMACPLIVYNNKGVTK